MRNPVYKPSTSEKRYHYRELHNKAWYKALPCFYRNCYDYMWDKASAGGVFATENLYDWQYDIYRDDSKFIDLDKIFDEINSKGRIVLRKLYDEKTNKETGEVAKKENGYWLIEDYYSIICPAGVLDVNKHQTSYEAGFINSCKAHKIPFKSIRGLSSFNLKKKKTKTKTNKRDENKK